MAPAAAGIKASEKRPTLKRVEGDQQLSAIPVFKSWTCSSFAARSSYSASQTS